MFVSNKLGRIFAAMCIALSMGTMWAQNITVKGRVTDSNGEPVVGAYVLVEGTRQEHLPILTVHIRLQLPGMALLSFCMGYRDLTVPVNGRSTIDVVLRKIQCFLKTPL